MSKRRPHIEDDEAWLMTYADMITLLLCFFLIMLCTMEPKQAKMEEIKKGFESEFSDSQDTGTPFTSILNGFESIIENMSMQQQMAVEETEKGVMIEMDSGAMFEPGSAVLKEGFRPALLKVAEQISFFEYDGEYTVTVEGHTDDVPIESGQFPSNWELSGARAAAVVRFLVGQEIMPERLRATGFADTTPKVPNRDKLGNPIPANQALNRRVAIRIERL